MLSNAVPLSPPHSRPISCAWVALRDCNARIILGIEQRREKAMGDNSSMTDAISEAVKRKTALQQELESAHRGAIFSAYANHYLSIGLMVAALGCSVAAGAMGFFTKYSSKVVGGFAVLPALIAYMAVNLKCEAKNSWHARRADGLDKLRTQLLYEPLENPTLEQIALVAKGRVELEERMQKEWDGNLLLSWSGFGRSATLQPTESSGARAPARRDRG
jgi:hypothetical protein